jgi:hypothetical protein
VRVVAAHDARAKGETHVNGSGAIDSEAASTASLTGLPTVAPRCRFSGSIGSTSMRRAWMRSPSAGWIPCCS